MLTLKLLKSLYGLMQSLRIFFENLKAIFYRLEYRQRINDSCLFFQGNLICVVYLDDCLFFAETKKVIRAVQQVRD